MTERTGAPAVAAGDPLFDYRSGGLRIGGTPVEELAKDHETPFFLLSAARMEANLDALQRGLAGSGARVALRYCAKTNHEAGVLERMAARGIALLASHAAEVELAREAGFPPERIAYQRPVPIPAEIRRAVELGVTRFSAYRIEDLAPLEEAAAHSGKILEVSFRLASSGWGVPGMLNRRLGMTGDEAVEAAKRAERTPHLRQGGLSFYLGTQQASAARFRSGMARAFALLRRVRTEAGVRLTEVDLGGGLPSPSLVRLRPGTLRGRFRDRLPALDPVPDLEARARELGRAFADLAGDSPPPDLVLEPGRSIVGNAGVLVTRVLAVRGSWLFVDASRNHLPESTLLFHRRILPGREREGARRTAHLSGSTLNTMDVLDCWRRLPRVEVGDVLVFCDAGAYSISRASRYAGLSPAVVLLERDGTARRIRRPEGSRDLLAPMEREGIAGRSP